MALLKKYFQTAVEEEMIKKGAATYWAADEDYIPIRDTSMRYMVSIYADAEAWTNGLRCRHPYCGR